VYSRNNDIAPDIEDEPDVHFRSRIIDYYCDCKTGARSLGCCSHVAAALLGARGDQDLLAKHAGREILDESTYQRNKEETDDTIVTEPIENEPILFTEKLDEIASEPEDQTDVIANFEKELKLIDQMPILDDKDSFDE